MKKSLFLLVAFALSVTFAFGQGAKGSNDKFWREIDDSGLKRNTIERTVVPSAYKTFALDKTALLNSLRNAPMEFTQAARNNSFTITMPMPDGTLARFTVEESPIFEPALAAQHPEIKTYRGQGIDDPTATARFDFTSKGFHSIILSPKGTVMIDPYAVNETGNYISYFKNDAAGSKGDFACHFNDDTEIPTSFFNFGIDAPNVVSGTNLRTYRLALAATGEYSQAVGGGTIDGALAAMATIMNRVNGVYEREVAIRMIIIANNRSIIYTDPSTDPYTNEDGFAMLGQNQANLDSVIGTTNYDIGHVFSTGGGGVASLRSPCNSNIKARGVTGLPNPVGDPFAIDFVAHEMGHQFGANHTFNIGSGSCGAQRADSAAYEPGSGITIMGYAGLCGNQNLALNSIDTFHVKSIEEIVSFSTTGAGNSCAVRTATGNNIPTVTRTTGLTIPKQTPFALSAVGTDPDGDVLTYDWQQYDLGAPATSIPNSDADGNPRPLFRPFMPVTGGTRTFPALTHILNSNNIPPTSSGGRLTGELLPAISRTMIFQVIVRDNRANGSGIRSVASVIEVDGTSGPFSVTAPNTAVTWEGGSTQTVTWSVANTNTAPVAAANVKISLSTNGGQTFPTVIAESTANDGSETISVPNVQTSQARIKIEAVDNIFFDISNANFTINASTIPTRTSFDYDGDGKSDVSVFRPSNGTWYLNQSTSGFTGVAFGLSTDKLVSADYDGDGKTDVAVYRDGIWYIQRSQLGFTGVAFGTAEDIPVPADYDGDGKADIAVFRPSNGTWYLLQSSAGFTGMAFGLGTDKPVPGDYDGDGKADIAVNRDGTWYIQRSQLGFMGMVFGEPTDKLVPADYDGDGKADIAVFRPSNGTWYIMRSQLGFTGMAFGLGTDKPVAADYDGDGKADIAVYRDGIWYLQRSQAGFTGVAFGEATDKPLQNSFVR